MKPDLNRTKSPSRQERKTYLGAGVASVLITMIVLLIACFAALTFLSARSEMKLSQKSETYCTDYYQAETLAVEILTDFFEEKAEITEDKEGNLVYNSAHGDIVIHRENSGLRFTVPINQKQGLRVAANISAEGIDISQWTVQ